MKVSIAIASVLAVAFSGSALSAKTLPKHKSEKPRDLSIQREIINDGYFAEGECKKYITHLPLSEQDIIQKASPLMEIEETIYYVSGNGTILADFQDLFKNTNYTFNPRLVESKDLLQNKPDLHRIYSDETYSKDRAEAAIKDFEAVALRHSKDLENPKAASHYLFCRIAAVATGMGMQADSFQPYVAYVSSRVKTADIGYFKVSVDSAHYGPSVNTGNRFAEPKKWEGSRFFVIRASFKNLDTESRLPSEGSLFINYNGKEYEFDSVEPIMLEGFNIWFKKVNPLIAMKTKIVYRIPDEIHGEVFWRPGRNSNGTKLWLGFIKAAEG